MPPTHSRTLDTARIQALPSQHVLSCVEHPGDVVQGEMRHSSSRGKLHPHRASEDGWGRESRQWKLTKSTLLFVLSFSVALHVYVKQYPSGESSRPYGRSLREADAVNSWATRHHGDGRSGSGWTSRSGSPAAPQRSKSSDAGSTPQTSSPPFGPPHVGSPALLHDVPAVCSSDAAIARSAEIHGTDLMAVPGEVGLDAVLSQRQGCNSCSKPFWRV